MQAPFLPLIPGINGKNGAMDFFLIIIQASPTRLGLFVHWAKYF
jgi:hypothetical protein